MTQRAGQPRLWYIAIYLRYLILVQARPIMLGRKMREMAGTESRTAWSVWYIAIYLRYLILVQARPIMMGRKMREMVGTESRTAWTVVHSYLPEVLDPGPGQANHDGQKDEGDGGYREQDSLVCGT